MRFLHLADLHIGKTVNGFNLIDDQRHALSCALDIAKRENVDAILLAGDIYDKQNPSVEAVELMGRFLTDVVKSDIVCLVVPGNHDSASRIAFGARIFARSGIYIAEKFQGRLEHVALTDEHGPVNFWLLPFVRPFELRHHFPEADIGVDYTRAIKAILEAAPVDFSERNVILAHQYVSFRSFQPQRSESETNVGGLDEVDGELFDGFDYVALGHIHKSQSVGVPTMRYAGSLLKYSFSEARYGKEFPLVTMGRKGEIDIDTVSFAPLHDMREITGPFDELTSPDIVQSAPADDYLHVTLTDPHPILDALQKIRAVYPHVMVLDYQSDVRRAKMQNSISSPAQTRINAYELFENFYEMQYGSPLTSAQRQQVRALLDSAIDEDFQESSPKTSCDEGGKHETA